MDFTTIIGLIGTLVTFEEAGRGSLPIIKNKRAKNAIKLSNWDSKDPTVQHVLDSFKSDVRAEYKEHIFSEVEMNEIANKFLGEKSYLNLSYEDKKKITEYIQDILGKYNDYTRSLMSTGESVLYEKLVSDNNEIKNMLSDIANKANKDNLAYEIDRIASVVAGIVTNGIQGVNHYISKETLQIHISNTIENVQLLYEVEFECKGKSLFIWQKNIEYYVCWLREGFLPREDDMPPIPYGEDQEKSITQKETEFIYDNMSRLVRENAELRNLHASMIFDDIHRMLKEKGRIKQNRDYYDYVKSFGNVLFLHKDGERQAITLKDTYVQPSYCFAAQSSVKGTGVEVDFMEMLRWFGEQHENRVIIIEGDAGVGKSSLISHVCYQNEKLLQECGNGIWNDGVVYCVRLRNLATNKYFMEVPVREILKELGLPADMEFGSRDIILLDGFDELCMMDGITRIAEQLLSEIIRGLSGAHIVITTRPKFIDIAGLRQRGIGTGIVYILLNHFDAIKREEWIQKYYKVCGKEDYPKLERIRMIDDETSEGICDTPLALYMLAAGKITDDAWNNPWVLYHQIFYEELSNTEYNKIFSKDAYTHGICRYNDVLYRISAEISYRMYQTGNTKLYVLQDDIEKIIEEMQLETNQVEQLIKRCYALCNYWKNDGKRGMAEFYHNNIRDFFLCEKIFFELEDIYRNFDPECMKNERKLDEAIKSFIIAFSRLCSYSDFQDKVSEFIYYRSLYKMEHETEEDFILLELKYQFLGYFFEKMFIHGAVYEYQYDGDRNLYEENMNVLKCVVQIYRHIYEPYVVNGKKRLEWFFNAESEMNSVEGFPGLFKPVFIRTPLTISSTYSIPVAGYANFSVCDMKKADLRYGMFNHSKFLSCDFSDTILKSTDFTGTILKQCSFTNADLSYSSLKDAQVVDCKLEGCNLIGTTLPDGSCFDSQQEQEEHLFDLLRKQK